MIKCPNIEDLILLALTPDREDFAELAAHVYGCAACLEELRLINEFVMTRFEITPQDICEMKDYLASKKQLPQSLWPKLKKLVDGITEKISGDTELRADANTNGFFTAFEINGDFATAALSSHDHDEMSPTYCGATVEIGFAAELPQGNPYYWYATLTIYPEVALDTILIVSVVNHEGESMEDGTLLLLGLELPVDNGIARLTFAELQDHIKNTEVSFIFADGIQIHGNLVIC